MKYLLSLMILFMSLHSIAEEQHSIVGVGTISCGKFLEGQKSPVLKSAMLSWAQGFLSGMNLANAANTDKDLLELPDSETINHYLVNYCTKNLLEKSVFGAALLYQEIRLREGNRSNN